MKEIIRYAGLGGVALALALLAGCFSRTVEETNTPPSAAVVEPAPAVVETAPATSSTTTTTTTGNGQVQRSTTTYYP